MCGQVRPAARDRPCPIAVGRTRAALFIYLEITYNRQRRHSSLNYRTPTEFNTEARAKLTSVH